MRCRNVRSAFLKPSVLGELAAVVVLRERRVGDHPVDRVSSHQSVAMERIVEMALLAELTQ
jgi:hypothetical protein